MNFSYQRVLAEIERIMKKDKVTKEIEDTFNHYAENVVNSDEAAAILTLAEVLKGREVPSSAKEDLSSEETGSTTAD